MKIFIALVFAALTSFAFASPGNDGCVGNCGTNGGGSGDIKNTNNIGVSNRISNDVRNNANAFAAAQAGAKSNAQNLTTTDVHNTNNNITGGNTLSVTTPANTSVRYSGTTTLRTTPQVYGPAMGVTAPCRIALSAGVSVVAVGVAGGGSIEDLKCNWRENARIAYGIGDLPTAKYWEVAIARLECIDADDKTRRALGDMCNAVGIPDPNAPTVQSLPAPAPIVPAVAPALY